MTKTDIIEIRLIELRADLAFYQEPETGRDYRTSRQIELIKSRIDALEKLKDKTNKEQNINYPQ